MKMFGSISLRALSFLSKLIFIIYLGRNFDLNTIGTYGTVAAFTGYFVLLLGFEFYNHSQRFFLSEKIDSNLVHNQILSYFLTYAMFLAPVIFTINHFGLHQAQLLILCIILAEHISQEIIRILIVRNEQLIAAFIFFIKTGAWPMLSILAFEQSLISKSLENILVVWFIFSVFAAFLGYLYLRRHIVKVKFKIEKIWLQNGIRVALKYAISVLALRAILTFDRFVAFEVFSEIDLTNYTLHLNFALALIALIEAATVQMNINSFMRFSDLGGHEYLLNKLKNLLQTLTLILIGSFVFIYALIPFFFNMIGRSEIVTTTAMLNSVFLFVVLCSINNVVNLIAYSLQHDLLIALANIIGFSIFCLLCLLFFDSLTPKNLIYILCVAFVFISLIKGTFITRRLRETI